MQLESLIEACEFHRNPETAAAMAKYMRNQFVFLGFKQPVRKELSKDFIKASRALEGKTILQLADQLWDMPERDYQYIAMELLYASKKKWDKSFLHFFLQLVTRKPWWDTVDFIASRLIGTYLAGEERPAEMLKWIKSKDLWQNRTALLFQLNYKTQTDADLLFETIEQLKHKKDFFIQKAIGWSLRQYHRTAPAMVEKFVESSGINGLAQREALKHAG